LVSDETDNPLGPPPWLNAPPVERYPYEDTHDLRSGPDLHPTLLALLPFVGLWRGRGQGGFPAEEDYNFAQEVRISHDGRTFIKYESRTWLLDEDSKPAGEWLNEVGYWRPVLTADGRATDEMEATMISPEGVAEIYLGKTIGTTRLEMEADAIAYTPGCTSPAAIGCSGSSRARCCTPTSWRWTTAACSRTCPRACCASADKGSGRGRIAEKAQKARRPR
jgi:hypothetical protein